MVPSSSRQRATASTTSPTHTGWNLACPSPTTGNTSGVSRISRACTLANSSCGPQITEGRSAVQSSPDPATASWALPLLARKRYGSDESAPFWLMLTKRRTPAARAASTTLIVPCVLIAS